MNGGLMRCDGVRSASWGLDRRVRLDLHDLVGWPRSETLGDDVPNACEVGALAGNHEHRRLFKGIRPAPCSASATGRFSTARAACRHSRPAPHPPLRVERTDPR